MTHSMISDGDVQYSVFETISRNCNLFPNQQVACVRVLDGFLEGNRYAMLSAEPQSGKSGVGKLIAFSTKLLKYNSLGIERVVVISSDNRKHLKAQWEDSWKESHGDMMKLCLTQSEDAVTDNEKMVALKMYVAASETNVEVYMRGSSEFKKLSQRGPTRDTLFIWDESDYGIGSESCFANFVDKMDWGICLRSGDQHSLQENNNYIMTVTATRGAEMAHVELLQSSQQILMEPGLNYRGLKWFMDNGRIHSVEKDFSNLSGILDGYAQEKKIIILRGGKKGRHQSEMYCAENQWEYTKLDQQNPSIVEPLKKWLDGPKTTPYVIGLKNFWGRGDDLSLVGVKEGEFAKDEFKSLICAWIETDVKTNSHTFLQRCARICGYHTNDTDLYCPKGPNHPDFGDYLDQLESGAEARQQSGGKYIKRRKNYTGAATRYTSHSLIVHLDALTVAEVDSGDDIYSPLGETPELRTPADARDLLTLVCNHTDLFSQSGITVEQQSQVKDYLRDTGMISQKNLYKDTAALYARQGGMAQRVLTSLRDPSARRGMVDDKPIIVFYNSRRGIEGLPYGIFFQFAPDILPRGRDSRCKGEDKNCKSLFALAPNENVVDEAQPENRSVEALLAACSWDKAILMQEVRKYCAMWDSLDGGQYEFDLNVDLNADYGSNLRDIKSCLSSDEFRGCRVLGKRGRSCENQKRIKFIFKNINREV